MAQAFWFLAFLVGIGSVALGFWLAITSPDNSAFAPVIVFFGAFIAFASFKEFTNPEPTR